MITRMGDHRHKPQLVLNFVVSPTWVSKYLRRSFVACLGMKFVNPLSDEQRRELEGVWREGAAHRERTRAHAVLLSAQGRSIAELSEILGAERDAVGRWLSHWEEGGVAALSDAARTGRPRRLVPEEEAALVAAAQASPASPRAELAKRGSPKLPTARAGRP